MRTHPQRGPIDRCALPDLFLSLQASSRTGRLHLEREGITRDLYLKAGLFIGADSPAGADSLEWLLFTAGRLSEERHGRVRFLIEAGMRPGRALVEAGGLSPASLFEWTERRARFLLLDVLSWRSGWYEFEEGATPPAGAIAVGLEPFEIVLAALRDGAGARILSSRLPRAEAVPLPVAPGLRPPRRLLPHEMYVLSLADGRRTVSEICSLSEIGETATLRALALLALAGCLGGAPGARDGLPARAGATGRGPAEPLVPAPADLPAGESPSQMRAMIRIYNDLYAFVCAYLIKEVGPIAEQLLDKHLRDVRDRHAGVFDRVAGGRESRLPEDAIVRNVNLIRDRHRSDALVAGLQEYLEGMVLAVRRILGHDHETRVVRRLRELRCART